MELNRLSRFGVDQASLKRGLKLKYIDSDKLLLLYGSEMDYFESNQPYGT